MTLNWLKMVNLFNNNCTLYYNNTRYMFFVAPLMYCLLRPVYCAAPKILGYEYSPTLNFRTISLMKSAPSLHARFLTTARDSPLVSSLLPSRKPVMLRRPLCDLTVLPSTMVLSSWRYYLNGFDFLDFWKLTESRLNLLWIPLSAHLLLVWTRKLISKARNDVNNCY